MRSFFMAAILLCNYSAISQESARGLILDANTQRPLHNAIVESNGIKFLSSNEGHFEVIPGNIISVSTLGYYKIDTIYSPGMVVRLFPVITDLNQVIITGNRTRQLRTEAPISISVISKQMIKETNAARADELLNKISGVNMISLGNEQHQMSIRQPITTRSLFLYLEDGIPLRTSGLYNHNAMLEINQPSISQIEIIKGPASAYYGAEAIGGVINILTQSAPEKLVTKISLQGSSRGYGRVDFQAGGTIKKTGLLFSGYHAFRHDLKVNHNNFYKTAATIRLDHKFQPSLRIMTDLTVINYYSEMPGNTDSARFFSKDFSSMYRFTYRKVPLIRMKSQLFKDWKNDGVSQVGIVYRNNEIEQNPNYRIRTTSDPLIAHGEINKSSFKTMMAFIQHNQPLKLLKGRINTGISIDNSPSSYSSRYINIERDQTGVFNSYKDSDSLLSDYKTNIINIAAYSGIDLSPFKGLKLSMALRYDNFNFEFNNYLNAYSFSGSSDLRKKFSRVTPKTGLTFNRRKLGGYVNYSQGFVPPQVSELFTGNRSPFLSPQEFNNYEAGIWYADGKHFQAELSYYILKGINEIISIRNPDGSSELANAGKTSHKGFELSIKYLPVSELQVKGNFSFAKHSFTIHEEKGQALNGKEMPGAPRFFGFFEIIYKPRQIPWLNFIIENQLVSSYFMDSRNQYKYGGFHSMNLRMGYRYGKIDLWLNAKNILNRHYAVIATRSGVSSYTPGDRRELNLGIGYTISRKNR